MDDKELARAFAAIANGHSVENYTDTPDYVLGEYLVDCLRAYNRAVRSRERHAGRPAPPAWMGRDNPILDGIAEDMGEAPATMSGQVVDLSIPEEWKTPPPRRAEAQDTIPPDERPPFAEPVRGHDL